MREIIIIGGGASGFAAAIMAAREGASVTILEKNEKPLRKLLLTGNGKCNISNLRGDADSFRSNLPDRARALYEKFNIVDTFAFFERLGIYITEKDGRAYPASESAASVAKLLMQEATALKVKIKTNQDVFDIRKDGDKFTVATDGWDYTADKVIIACGTNASVDNAGRLIAETAAIKFGIRHHKYLPALTKLYGEGEYLEKWAGVRTFGTVKMFCDNTYVTEDYGELQLVNTGVSGIPVFQISRYANIMLYRDHKVKLEIDFLPDCDDKMLKEIIGKIQANAPYKSMRDALIGLLPERLVNAVIDNDYSIDRTVRTIKHFEFPVTAGSKICESQVCSGGIDLDEISDDFECRKVPGLYFTGEALDVDGACGGFNLQWAWTSGATAGRAAAKA